MKKHLLLFIALLGLSCGDSIKESQEMRNELRYLETELITIQSSPAYKLGEAFDFINEKNYDEALSLIKNIRENFPDWNGALLEEIIERIEIIKDKAGIFEQSTN